MAGRKDNAAKCPILPNNTRYGWSGKNAVSTNQRPTEPISRRHFEDDLDGLPVVVTAIPS